MADTTIVNLPALAATPAVDDLIEMVDISDTGNNATGENKKMTVAELVAAAGGGGGGMTLIASIDLSVTGSAEWLTLSQAYTRLKLFGEYRSSSAVTQDGVHMYFNGDETDANYHHAFIGIDNAGVIDQESASPKLSNAPGSSSPAGANCNVSAVMENYSATGNLKSARTNWSMYSANDHIVTGQIGVFWDTTDPITSILVRTDGSDAMTGTLHLYGEM